ncbi:MAG: hypothetical protein HN941_07360 [Proteobacteria bacterium]|nr:hypothetical protein [Pseudomonadota bacterium]
MLSLSSTIAAGLPDPVDKLLLSAGVSPHNLSIVMRRVGAQSARWLCGICQQKK